MKRAITFFLMCMTFFLQAQEWTGLIEMPPNTLIRDYTTDQHKRLYVLFSSFSASVFNDFEIVKGDNLLIFETNGTVLSHTPLVESETLHFYNLNLDK